jgi:CubicO group peptidase (beta-lactamase class C family)
LPAPEALAGELRHLLRRAQSEGRLPSISAAVFRGPEQVWADAVGLAEVERAIEAKPDTQYEIGSITKSFTAAAILQLRDAGVLDLDDPLSQHVPESGDDLSLRRLLAHLSGLQRETPGRVWETLEFPTREELPALAASAERVLPPGEQWHYSNLAFALLGEVVARRSGMPYTQYVDEHLLVPLALRRTTWTAKEPAARGYFVHPYVDRVEPEQAVDHRGTAAAGALHSTTGDLARWSAFLADPDPGVLAPASVDEMQSVQVMVDVDRWSLAWGLGLGLYRRGDSVFFGHGGATKGFLAGSMVSRPHRIGAVVLMNATAGVDPEALALELARASIASLPPELEPWALDEAPPAELESVLGRWWSEGTEFVFRWRGGRLEAESLAAAPHRRFASFEHVERDRFRTVSGRERGELLEIARGAKGEAVKLYWATYPFTREPTTFG